jgi:hypothetical protein
MTCVTRTMKGGWSLEFKLRLKLQTMKPLTKIGLRNECLRHHTRGPLAYVMNLFNHCIRRSHFPTSWKEAKMVTSEKPGRDTNFPKIHIWLTSRPWRACYLGKLYEKLSKGTLKKVACLMQTSLNSLHVTAWQCNVWGLRTTWHLHKLSKLEFSTSLKKLITFSFAKKKFRQKAKCLRHGKCKKGCLKILSCPPHSTGCA